MPELTVNLSIKIQVAEKQDTEYYLNPITNEATPSFIADIMDEMEDSFAGEVISVNGLTQQQVLKKLQEGVV
jgi:hypothetical protein